MTDPTISHARMRDLARLGRARRQHDLVASAT
jgi:hypothetical protein